MRTLMIMTAHGMAKVGCRVDMRGLKSAWTLTLTRTLTEAGAGSAGCHTPHNRHQEARSANVGAG